MFNRKLLSVLAYMVAVLLAAKALLAIVMFVWAYFATPPVVMFPAGIAGHLQYLLLLQELGTVLFIYLAVGALKALGTCSCHLNFGDMAKQAMDDSVKKVKKVSRRAKKSTSKKK